MFGALLRQTLKSLTRAPLAQLITIALLAVSLSLLALSATLLMNLDRLSERWGDGGELLVVLSPGLEPARYEALRSSLLMIEGVKSATLQSPQEAQEEMSEAVHLSLEELSSALQALPGTIELRVLEPNEPARLSAIRAQVLDTAGVLEIASVSDGEGLLAQLYSLRKALSSWLWLLGAWVALSVSFLITQLVRLTLYQRQRELDIWVTVGASELLILGPIMIEAALQTGLGAWLALAGVNSALEGLQAGGAQTLSLIELELSPLPLSGRLALILASMLLGAISSFRVARSALREERSL